MPKKAHSSLITKITISPEKMTLALLPLMLDSSGKPKIPTPEQAFSILSNIAHLSAKLETNVVVKNNVGYVTVE
jgi:hypothetical protein